MNTIAYLLNVIWWVRIFAQTGDFDYPDSRCIQLQALLPLSKSNKGEKHITSFEIPYFGLFHEIKTLKLEECQKTIEGERPICKVIGFNNFLKYLDPVSPNSWSIQGLTM